MDRPQCITIQDGVAIDKQVNCETFRFKRKQTRGIVHASCLNVNDSKSLKMVSVKDTETLDKIF